MAFSCTTQKPAGRTAQMAAAVNKVFGHTWPQKAEATPKLSTWAMPGSAPPCASRCRAFRVSNMPADRGRQHWGRTQIVPSWHGATVHAARFSLRAHGATAAQRVLHRTLLGPHRM
jgi:hypothetical protein